MSRTRPIRKDRVAAAGVILVGVIVVPLLLLFRSGGPAPDVAPIDLGSIEGTDAGELSGELATSPSGASTPPVATPLQSGTPAAPPATSPTPGSATPTSPSNKDGPAVSQAGSPLLLEHTVSRGETLTQIASRLGVTVWQLEASNRIWDPTAIQPGQVLRTPARGILHLVKSSQTLADIAATYAVALKDIVALNGIADPSVIRAGEELIIPPSAVSPWSSVIHLSKGTESRFIWPLLGSVVSPFGWRVHPVLGYRHEHNGIDIDVPTGTTVHAAASGRVVFAGDQEGYGAYLAIEHADGFVTGYGHVSKFLVRRGQFVEAGQGIALSGNTGISSGPHLHFEIRNGTFAIDPGRYLP